MNQQPPKKTTTIDALREFASAGAILATSVFPHFVDQELLSSEPRLAGALDPFPDDDWSAGVFFEMEGDVTGPIGILFTEDTVDAVATRGPLAGAEGAGGSESMVLELGNIVASQTVSVIADAIGGRILHSIPAFVRGRAEREFAYRIARLCDRDTGEAQKRMEIEFVDLDSRLRILLVMLPIFEE